MNSETLRCNGLADGPFSPNFSSGQAPNEEHCNKLTYAWTICKVSHSTLQVVRIPDPCDSFAPRGTVIKLVSLIPLPEHAFRSAPKTRRGMVIPANLNLRRNSLTAMDVNSVYVYLVRALGGV